MSLSPAQRHSQRVAMQQQLARLESVNTANSLHTQVQEITADVERLRNLQMVAERVEMKRTELLPKWMPTVTSYLELGKPYANPVFAYCIIWLFDVGDYAESDITGKAAITVGKELVEKIGQLRQSVAGTRQEIIAPVVWIGSEQINVAQLMLDTVALVQQLATQLASHTHPSTGQPTNSAAIGQSATQATALAAKYSPVIG